MNDIARLSSRPWIGGSSIAAICGLSPYSTPLDVWMGITGRSPEITMQQEQFFDGRRALEPYIVSKLKAKFGVTPTAMNVRYRDEEFPHFAAEIDAETEDENYELKTVSQWVGRDFGEEGSDTFPVQYAAQVQWGLGIRKKPRAWLTACIGFDDLRRFPVEPDWEVIGTLRAKATQFWNDYVLTDTPPPPITLQDALTLWPKGIGGSIVATSTVRPEILDGLARHTELRNHAKELEAKVDEAKLKVQAMLGDAELVMDASGKTIASWKNNKDSLVLDQSELIQRMQAELLKCGPMYLDWITEQRKALTTPKPGPRVFRNSLK